MDGKKKIKKYREKLDRTLACHDLADKDVLTELVKQHLMKSSSRNESEGEILSILAKRTQVISNFLDMLRSASAKEPEISQTRETTREWKIKEDNEDYRIMYREGPPGTLFHDLLVEGYIDGPIDVSLCVSMEAPLYESWWPQYSIPTFKVISSECLHHVRIGERIASIKAKVSWPISSRECVLHYIEFEFFQEDLIVVVLNSISSPDGIEKSSHGIDKAMIPTEEKGMIRMGLVGGFALQKVTNGRSYFRTMGSVDLKLGFVPSWLVNFMARQLIGSGFKLYKKAVSSWAKTRNSKFQHALDDPLYVRVRDALISNKNLSIDLEQQSLMGDNCDAAMLNGIEEDSKSMETVKH